MFVLIVSLQSHVCADQHQDAQSHEKDGEKNPQPLPYQIQMTTEELESQDQNIELYTKLSGNYRTTDIPLQENN